MKLFFWIVVLLVLVSQLNGQSANRHKRWSIVVYHAEQVLKNQAEYERRRTEEMQRRVKIVLPGDEIFPVTSENYFY
ncbi:unnamed protein product [Caenorhabditis nigoni]